LTIDRLNLLLLVASAVLLVAVAAIKLSSRSGLPTLLIYLGIGVLIGADGIGLEFNDAELTQVLGYAALVVILAEGGMTAKWQDIKPAAPAAAVLAVLGTGVSVAVTAAAAHWLTGADWRTALLLGTVVSSTDAAAVFSVLRKVPLPRRITGLLEAESGFNDAPVVILVVALSASDGTGPWYLLGGTIVLELAIGLLAGIVIGRLGVLAVRKLALPSSGLHPLAVVSFAVLAYAAAAMAHGSGFLAVYICALILGNARLPHRPATLAFVEGLAWVAQIGMFVLLGLLVTPHNLGDAVLPAVIVGLVLVLIARPLSVVLSLLPFRTPWRDQVLISWAGLRGAVPIILATVPVVAQVPHSGQVFNTVFVLVIVFTLVQGPTLPWVARKLGLSRGPGPADLGIESAPLERLHGHLLSTQIPPGSKLHGVEVSELRLPSGAGVTLVVRDGSSFVPVPSTVLQRGDELLVVATDQVRDDTERRLRAVARGGKLATWFGEYGRED
jgi:cell volume regulation protein A